jgi:hypothetical protein
MRPFTSIATERPAEVGETHLPQEDMLEGACFRPCPQCGGRTVRAYGRLLVCAICEHVFWRSEG